MINFFSILKLIMMKKDIKKKVKLNLCLICFYLNSLIIYNNLIKLKK